MKRLLALCLLSTVLWADPLSICSFNIQFLGSSRSRDNAKLASICSLYDVVLVQELVAPPHDMFFPDGTPAKPDPEARAFFDAMALHGFSWWLSEEDTGPGSRIHSNGNGTEWWVVFYRQEKVSAASYLPHGFLAEDRSANPDYDRVPYAFSLRSSDKSVDFVLVSAHLRPGDGRKDTARRRHELKSIAEWIASRDTSEKDWLIVGDCNFKDMEDLVECLPDGFVSLNRKCVPTNVSVSSPRPYDHVLYCQDGLRELDVEFGFRVLDLRTLLAHDIVPLSMLEVVFYRNRFRTMYSDHNPVVFRIHSDGTDDD